MGLSKDQMAEVIAGGGSVLHNGRLITKMENLPAADEMAQTPEEKRAAVDDIDAQMKELQARRDRLNAPAGGALSNGSPGGDALTLESLNKMKKADLQKLATDRSLQFEDKTTIAELSDLIFAHENKAQ